MNLVNLVLILMICIIILGSLGIIYANSYNKLQFLRTKIQQSENLAEESLNQKFDLIIKINGLIKKILKNKKNYLKNYLDLKERNISHFELDHELTEAIAIIDAVIGDYEKLEKNKEIQTMLGEIKNNDEKLTAAKIYYNKNTTESNKLIRTFPTVIVAKIHRFKIKPCFDTKSQELEITDDFKF